MGIPYADIALESIFPRRRLEVKALVDSGSVFLTVPQHIAVQLGFDTEEARTREVILADGSRKAVPMILKNAFDRVQSSYMSGRLWALAMCWETPDG
jgi:hypothetical protein